MSKRPKKLLDRVREAIRRKHYSIRTEQAYVAWIKRYILFHNKRHPKEMGSAEVEALVERGAGGSSTSSKRDGNRISTSSEPRKSKRRLAGVQAQGHPKRLAAWGLRKPTDLRPHSTCCLMDGQS